MVYVLNGHETSGTTANRPSNAEAGFQYYDTTIGALVVLDENGNWSDAAGEIAAVGGIEAAAESVTPNNTSDAASAIAQGVVAADVGAVTNDADDWIVLPAVADVPVGHEIRIACNAGTNFELRTPASSGEKINNVVADGTQEYLCTDTDTVVVRKISDTDGWAATSFTVLGAVRTAVVPD